MQIKPGEALSSRQFMSTVACFILASSLLSSFFVLISLQDSWFVVIVGSIISIVFVEIYLKLIKKFPRMNLMEINQAVFGPILGKIVSILYLWQFLNYASFNLKDMGNFVVEDMIDQTPVIVVYLTFLFICGWAVRNGVDAIARYGAVVAVFTLTILLLTLVLLFNRMDFLNFMPILAQPVKKYIQTVNIVLTIPSGEVVMFLMIAPNVKEQDKIPRAFFKGMAIGLGGMLITVLRDTAVLGNLMESMMMPSYETMRFAGVEEALPRTDVFYAMILLILLFYKIVLLYYVLVLGFKELFGFSSLHPFVFITGACILVYAYILYPTPAAHAQFSQQTAPILWLVVEFVLPLITLVVSSVKKTEVKENAA